MSTGILKVRGDEIVGEDGKSIILRGTALGGWMNMENFITGYPGHEHEHRASMLKVLGQEKYEYFFDKFLEYFFTEKDAEFFASKGLNCLRLPLNFRHFEDDMNPRVLKEGGFKHVDRVVELCAKYKIYTILDLHALPGGQNQDWHSDNATNYAAFWDYKDHQDRVVWLWKEMAKRYKDNAWVAGVLQNRKRRCADEILTMGDRIQPNQRAMRPVALSSPPVLRSDREGDSSN